MSDVREFPAVPPPDWERIPASLAQRPQWLLWRYEVNPKKPDGKPLKVPYYVAGGRRTGDQGSDRDRARLVTLMTARHAFEKGKWTGIGFAFLPKDGLVGIDIDHAIDPETGEVSPRCLNIVQACASYTEHSPSRTGVHIIVEGETETAKDNGIGVEMFCGSQYFTFTGASWDSMPSEVQPLAEAVFRRLHATIEEGKKATRQHAAAPPPATEPGHESSAQIRARVESALEAMQPDMGYDDWISIGWALKDAFGDFGFGLWNAWSARGGTYPGEADLQSHWRSFRPRGKTLDQAVAVIFARARDAGYRPQKAKAPRKTRRAPRGDGEGERPTPAPPPAGGGGGDSPPPEDPLDGDAEGDGQEEAWAHLVKRNGRPVDCRENVLYCMRHDKQLKGLVRQNLFTELHERSRNSPWGREPGEWDEEDDLMLGEYLVRHYGLMLKSPSTLRAGVLMAAREHKFNPVQDLIRSEEWDGTDRLDHWLVRVFGAEDRPYVRLVGRLFIMGMVQRAMRPGCKFDYMLILKGEQGLLKSGAFRVLAEPWFTDNAIRVGDKDSQLAMQLVWLAESAELESMNKAESTAIKQFLSAQDDMFRPPYGARMLKRPRHAVIGGTTNADVFLRDATGDRRFWPLEVLSVDIELLRQLRLQLFAEALHRLKAGEPYWPSREQERDLVFPEQEKFKVTDVWEDKLYAYVNNTSPPANSPMVKPAVEREFFSTIELFTALGIATDRIDGNKQMETRIGNAMRALGFKRFRETTGPRKRGYVRPPPQDHDDGPPGAQPDAAGEGDSDLPI